MKYWPALLAALMMVPLTGCGPFNAKGVFASAQTQASNAVSTNIALSSTGSSGSSDYISSSRVSSSQSSAAAVSSQAASSKASSAPASHPQTGPYQPPSMSEMRGVWLVTAYGNEFPKKQADAAEQKKELAQIVANVKAAHLNTIFFQVRPMSDAFYRSSVYPWSAYLTGTQGKDPGYDPLACLIDEAHKNGIAVQAWINPYRAGETGSRSRMAASNPAKLHSGWTVTEGSVIWYNPGLPEVRSMIVSGVTEIVKKYNVDGIHFDDYFYPGTDFNDSAAYKKYGGGKSLADWRRANVDSLISEVHAAVRTVNPKIPFGISPRAIWAKSGDLAGGVQIAVPAQSSYAEQYADSKKWVENHWVDYICPQIYWGFSQPRKPPYAAVVDWWDSLCAKSGVPLYVGHSDTIVLGGAGYWTDNTGKNQVQYARGKKSYRGSVFFSYSTLTQIMQKQLFKGLYY